MSRGTVARTAPADVGRKVLPGLGFAPMRVEDLGIAGVQRIPLEPHEGPRGSLTEVFRRSWVGGGAEAVQANLSRSNPGVLHGLHWHRRNPLDG